MRDPSRRGFTLVEVVVALALVAVLLSITTAKVKGNKAAAAMAVMKSDLRNIASAQEAYWAGHQTFADDIDELGASLSPNITAQVRGSATGWSARTEHVLRSDWRCAMFIGSGVAKFDPATEEGILACLPKGVPGGCFGG